MAKRPRFSRWRRLPPVFRTGEHRPIGTGNELDRIILYLPARSLDLAEALAEKAGIPAIQDYCGRLLNQALESEKDRQKVIGFEARSGPLEGLKEIAADPDYLAEWQLESESRPAPLPSPPVDAITVDFVLADGRRPASCRGEPDEGEEIAWIEDARDDRPAAWSPASPSPPPIRNRSRSRRRPGRWSAWSPTGRRWRSSGGTSALTATTRAFLPCLRRGVPVPAAGSAELVRALHQLEPEHRGAEVLDRRMAHALHRLALESQVLLTDAWPGAFDARMIAVIRAVQEAVERILSGQDIRY